MAQSTQQSSNLSKIEVLSISKNYSTHPNIFFYILLFLDHNEPWWNNPSNLLRLQVWIQYLETPHFNALF